MLTTTNNKENLQTTFVKETDTKEWPRKSGSTETTDLRRFYRL